MRLLGRKLRPSLIFLPNPPRAVVDVPSADSQYLMVEPLFNEFLAIGAAALGRIRQDDERARDEVRHSYIARGITVHPVD